MLKVLFFISFWLHQISAFSWPIPYHRLPSRPRNNLFCKAGLVPFCPAGITFDDIPRTFGNDTIEVFSLKKPVWSFKFGPVLGYFHVMHDGLGFRNTRTGLNYTMEWYELDQLFNCTFPHTVNDSLTWCNQGALCLYPGINDTVWNEYGTIEKISTINGSIFSRFANWSIWDNNTAVYYETWTVSNTDNITDPSLTMYFDSFDCASWVLRAIDTIYQFGGRFNQSVNLNYTRLNLYGEEPVLLGNLTQIWANQTLRNQTLEFYKSFQKRTDYLQQAIEIYEDITVKKEFYFYFNDLYWYLTLKPPYIKITYYNTPLPGK